MATKETFHFEVCYPGTRTPMYQYILPNETFWGALKYAASNLLKGDGTEIVVYTAHRKSGSRVTRFGMPNGMLKRVPGGIFWGTLDGKSGYIYPSVKDFGTLNRKEIGFKRS